MPPAFFPAQLGNALIVNDLVTTKMASVDTDNGTIHHDVDTVGACPH